MNNLERKECIVKRVIYQNDDNGFSVMICEEKDNKNKQQIIGTLPGIRIGSELILEGFYKINDKYGKQFNVVSYEEILPDSIAGIKKYLCSGVIKGIGSRTAEKIVNKFGEKTLEILDKDPEKLSEITGIGKKLIEKIKMMNENRDIMIFLYSCGVNKSLASKICSSYYGLNIEDIIRENPYRLIRDIRGIDFKTVEMIAKNIGFDREKYERMSEGLLYTLELLSEQGHCYATRNQLLNKSKTLLEVNRSLLDNTLEKMIKNNNVCCEKLADDDSQTAIFLPQLFRAEYGTEKNLYRIQNCSQRITFRPAFNYDCFSQYDPDQISAIHTAMHNKIMILTGGPGTGKTTTIKGIIDVYRAERGKVLLAAPTGRAAKRLSEATGMEAKTIHRLLDYKPNVGYQLCRLNGDVLIIDECSMVDINLMYALLDAVPDNMSLILVGDADQLPSIGPGNVLHDLIKSKRIPAIKLTNIHRQAQTSRIVTNAHLINSGQMPDISNGKDTDFYFVEKTDTDAVADTIIDLVSTRLPQYLKITPSEIQVLAPMKEKTVGTIYLNNMLQEALNPAKKGLKRGNYTFKVHDKVMQIKNNYEKDVFNGDIGKITSVDATEDELKVDFGGRVIVYKLQELNELTLAYAITIHKGQGSEYPVVVMPCDMSNEIMLQRNLLYTAVTRAKKLFVIVGSKEALTCAVQNNHVTLRNTMLEKIITSRYE